MAKTAAALLAPIPLVFFFVATSPSGSQINAVLLWAGSYVLAHIVFWPSALLTRYLGRRLKVVSTVHSAVWMAVCAALITGLLAVVPDLILNRSYTWRAGLRDSLTVAIAAASCWVLYRALLALRHRTAVRGGT